MDADSLDAAWAEAVAALPSEEWTGPNFGRNSDGTSWAAVYRGSSVRDHVKAEGVFDTPAAALRALAVALRGRY